MATLAFSFLNGDMLLGWWITLLASSIRAASNGVSGVWRTPVREHLGWSKNATPPLSGRPATTTYPTLQPGILPQQQQPCWPQQGYGIPPPQQPYGAPQPQQGYGIPAPQQDYRTPQPRAICGAPAPGSPPDASQG
ncbi:hypothetical protein FS837_006410 [Tulasnella sp. UAMH 9824]|nr:hypothetical protein FS837_006410 [Tulasnella sp. UAMH 9824]